MSSRPPLLHSVRGGRRTRTDEPSHKPQVFVCACKQTHVLGTGWGVGVLCTPSTPDTSCRAWGTHRCPERRGAWQQPPTTPAASHSPAPGQAVLRTGVGHPCNESAANSVNIDAEQQWTGASLVVFLMPKKNVDLIRFNRSGGCKLASGRAMQHSRRACAVGRAWGSLKPR